MIKLSLDQPFKLLLIRFINPLPHPPSLAHSIPRPPHRQTVTIHHPLSTKRIITMSKTASTNIDNVTRHKVEGYQPFVDFMQTLAVPAGQKVNVYFSGSLDTTTGKNWCPDCVEAEPFVTGALKRIAEPSQFVYVVVGDRTFWKDIKNPFRLDKNTRLSVIPTLIRWKGPQRLEGDQLNKPELLDMFFEDE